MSRLSGLIMACAAMAAHSGGLTAQAISGEVVDQGSLAPIEGVHLAIHDSTGALVARSLTAKDGRFATVLPQAGVYLLRLDRLGYDSTDVADVHVTVARVAVVQVKMTPRAIDLDPLTVTAEARGIVRREFIDYESRLDRFKHFEGIRMFPREELAKRDTWTFAEFMRRIAPRVGTAGSTCRPLVFWNGREMAPNPLMSLQFFEGIEFYGGLGPPGSRYINPDYCGVVLVWSRSYLGTRGKGG